MSQINEAIAFNSEEIRDTSVHTSPVIDNRGFSIKTLIIENSLNQLVELTCEGSAREDFSEYFSIGLFEQAASTNGYQTCESYIPFWRLKAQCTSSPSSGELTVFVERITD